MLSGPGRRGGVWVAVATALLLGAALLALGSSSPGRPSDPRSARPDGSLALAHLVTRYGSPVRTTDVLPGRSAGTVVVVAPDDYSAAQLRRLRDTSRLVVLVRPGAAAVAALLPGVHPDAGATADADPGCADQGARAAGMIDVPADAVAYRGAPGCYGGLLVRTPRVAVLGSAQLLHNDHLAGSGVAALDVDVLTADRGIGTVTWVLPGSDAAGPGPASVWQLFPPAVRRAFWAVLALGGLLALWRGRRLGGVVSEPLPVVVRSVEAVEGHGRLYARAGARDRAATALRSAAVARLAARLTLPRGVPADQVAVAAAPLAHRPAAELVGLLAGAAPVDDAHLVRLAGDLDRLEAAIARADR